jgi:hypothetical protein
MTVTVVQGAIRYVCGMTVHGAYIHGMRRNSCHTPIRLRLGAGCNKYILAHLCNTRYELRKYIAPRANRVKFPKSNLFYIKISKTVK